MAQDDTGTESAVETPTDAGTRLRTAREAMGLSIQDAANRTRQPQMLLNALENMETGGYSPSYVRLHAKQYAQILGLPGDEIARAFAPEPAITDSSRMPGAKLEPPKRHGQQLLLLGIGGAAALAIAGIAVLLWPQTSAPRVEAPVSSKVAGAVTDRSVTLLPQQSVVGPELRIVAKRRAFIEVRAADGTVFRSREMSAGEAYFPRVGAGWTLTVQDAGAFEWHLGDDIVGPIGADMTAMYGISIDDAMESALETVSEALADASAGEENPR